MRNHQNTLQLELRLVKSIGKDYLKLKEKVQKQNEDSRLRIHMEDFDYFIKLENAFNKICGNSIKDGKFISTTSEVFGNLNLRCKYTPLKGNAVILKLHHGRLETESPGRRIFWIYPPDKPGVAVVVAILKHKELRKVKSYNLSYDMIDSLIKF